MFGIEEMIADRKKYFVMMMKAGSNNMALQICLDLESKYGLYGASPEMFTNYLSDEIKSAQSTLKEQATCLQKHQNKLNN